MSQQATGSRNEGSSSTSSKRVRPPVSWLPPAKLQPHPVLPDRCTDLEAVKSNLPGREVDPGRMSIYMCTLDDRPHIHPSLADLHKHRLAVHSIPLPSDPNTDLPISSKDSTLSPTVQPDHPSQSGQAATQSDTIMENGTTAQEGGPPLEIRVEGESTELGENGNDEWMTWQFTEEEEARRKAYLPLA